ncbi:hypothetical protein GCM10027296_11770 [Chitinimonas naiadis]
MAIADAARMDGFIVTQTQWDSPDTTLGSEGQLLVEREHFQIRLANTRANHADIGLLVDRMYSWRGYMLDRSEDDVLSGLGRTTLQACSSESTLGTLTLNIDTGHGLQADDLYKREIDVLRSQGRKVCELTRLAVDNRSSSMELLASLFHLLHLFGRHMGMSDAVIEVNPRHVGFYRRLLGFQVAGEQRTCARVEAPAVLMHVEASYVEAQIARHAGRLEKARQSLYPYFFPLSEVEGLSQRIFQVSQPAI